MLHDVVLIPLPQQPQSNPGAPSATQSGGGAPDAGQTGTQPPASGGGTAPAQPDLCGTQPLLMMLLMGAVIWFMLIGPDRKRRKETQSMLAAMKPGARAVPIGGMHGVVVSIAEKTVTLRCEQQRFTFDRSAVARIERDEPPAEPKKA